MQAVIVLWESMDWPVLLDAVVAVGAEDAGVVAAVAVVAVVDVVDVLVAVDDSFLKILGRTSQEFFRFSQ